MRFVGKVQVEADIDQNDNCSSYSSDYDGNNNAPDDIVFVFIFFITVKP